MTAARRLTVVGVLIAAVTIIGTIGFWLLEPEIDLLEGLYQTVITISTVGFGEVEPLGSPARLFSVVLILAGVGAVFYTAGTAVELTLENLGHRQRRAMQKSIDQLADHYLVCGYGRVGQHAFAHIRDDGHDSVVIESDHAKAELARSDGALVVEGDASHNDSLVAAGIERAGGLVACVREDSQNLVIVLSARSLRPDLLIVARAHDEEAEDKLVLAGADRVVAPQVVGGHRLAALVLHRDLSDVIDFVHQGRSVEFRVEEFEIGRGSQLDGVPLRTSEIRAKAGVTVFAIEDNIGQLLVNPDPDHVLRAGERIVVIGRLDQLEQLRPMVA